MTLEDVRLWAVGERGIGHVVYAMRSNWVSTVCDQVSPSYAIQAERPPRICATCRTRIKTAKLC